MKANKEQYRSKLIEKALFKKELKELLEQHTQHGELDNGDYVRYFTYSHFGNSFADFLDDLQKLMEKYSSLKFKEDELKLDIDI